MELIANYWWIWLVVFLGSVFAAIVINFINLRDTAKTVTTGISGVLKGDHERVGSAVADMIENVHSSFFSRLWKFLLVTLLGWVSGVLLLISIVLNIIKMFTQ